MDRLISTGKVTRGYLGINIQPLSPTLAREFHLPEKSSGVLVGGVMPDSAAAKAGVQAGDLITKLNGNPVADPRSLQLRVSQLEPGSKVELQVLRSEPGNRAVTKTLTATLDTLPPEALASMGGRSAPEEQNNRQKDMDALDGVEVGEIDQAARQELKIPRSVHGALVVKVDPNSKAAAAGLREGDVIVEINRQPVRDADGAVALSEKVKGERVLLRVWSRAGGGPGGTHYIVVENGKNQ